MSLDVAADIVNGRTLVPVRAVSEAFDLTVDWDGNNRTITVGATASEYNKSRGDTNE